ncbi:MAG: PAS domain S-box protein [Bacteroidia bacterium]|nr:PAS domain S-box protein [Bacteroidia bacterium]
MFIKNRIDTLNIHANQTIQLNSSVAKEYADQALVLSEKIQYSQGQAEACEILGMFYASKDEFAEALKMFFKFLELEKHLENMDKEIRGNLRVSAIYLRIQNFERAKQYIENALILAKKERSAKSLGWVYHYFGLYYYEIRDTNAALIAALKSYEYFRETVDYEMLARSEKLLGDIYIELSRFDDAIHSYNKAIEFFNETNLIVEKGILLTRIAHVYQLKSDLNAVLRYNSQALRIRESLENSTLISHSLVNIGKTYALLGESDSALHFFQRGLQVAIKSDNNYVIQNAYYQLYVYYTAIGNLQAALENSQLYFKSYNKYAEERTKSEIFSIEIKSQIEVFEAQNQLLKQELEIQTLQLKTRSYSELLTQLIIGIIGVLLVLTFYIIERNKLGKSKLETINKQLNQEVEERKLTEVQLRTSEELYRFVTEHTLDLIVRMDRNFNYLFISPSILRIFGYSQEEMSNVPALGELIPQKFQDELWAQYREMIRTKEPVMLTHQSLRMDGSLFWSESLVNPIFDKTTGRLKETITVIRDITDRVAYEEALTDNARQKELLLREIHHRVKNNFAILVSLMNMQKLNSDPGDFKEFLTELQGRIRTMSLVHELLYRSYDIDYIDFGEYLSQLVSIISRAYKNKPVAIHSTFDNCILDVETALPLGLISNEILTNAYKYAFINNPKGEMWIDLQKYPDDGNPEGLFTHTLTIRDNGPGLPEGFSPEIQSSMGSQIITLLVEQLEGRLDFSGEGGTSFTICFSDEKRS